MEEDREKKKIRCAIYTRKSTNEGLEKDFTSLDAQRESAESYIRSQQHQGWMLLPEKYDDGGFTGATMERPALQKLLEAIRQQKVDCVVVYKVDRLSRSLADFVKLLQFFEEQKVAFVSVTQHFNTNTSMGRLTLNILLSFAQFEREMISERTKDKMGAARIKGKWVGGRPPLGYDIDRNLRKLIANPKEADLVRDIFRLYLEKKSLLEVARTLNQRGHRTKTVRTEHKTTGGVPFKNTNIQIILKNVTYLGKVEYGGKIYPGEHAAIIDEDVFNKAQEIKKQNIRERGTTKNRKFLGLLSGIFRCTCCNTSMTHGYTQKKSSKYRYYTCLNAIKRNRKDCPTKSMGAVSIERRVIELLKAITSKEVLEEDEWQKLGLEKQIEQIQSLVKLIEYDGRKGKLWITLKESSQKHEFDLPLDHLKKQSGTPSNKFFNEPPIRRQLLLAHQIQEMLDDGRVKDLQQLSDWLGISKARLEQIMSLLFLAPAIQEEIMCGNLHHLAKISEYPLRPISIEMDWDKQLSAWSQLIPTV
ncbi:MAG: recombinase family protein [Candidatus Omnitrophica bacterium]|nr:recombinase family protein [Candidatus Omnitrophota bacterium]MDD5670032.1 recombinase family protein [Candidatus Omnitrophota bacterium]